MPIVCSFIYKEGFIKSLSYTNNYETVFVSNVLWDVTANYVSLAMTKVDEIASPDFVRFAMTEIKRRYVCN